MIEIRIQSFLYLTVRGTVRVPNLSVIVDCTTVRRTVQVVGMAHTVFVQDCTSTCTTVILHNIYRYLKYPSTTSHNQ